MTWLARSGRARGHLVEAAVRALLADGHAAGARGRAAGAEDEVLWESPAGVTSTAPDGVYAWVAGEAGMVRSVRRLLVDGAGYDRLRVAFMGYWRQGRAESA